MAKVKQDTTADSGGKKEKVETPKKPGRNDLVNDTTKNGKATFVFAEIMTVTGEFTSYNGGKGTHAYCVVRNDGQEFKSGRTGLKYLKHTDGKTLFEHVASQSKRGRPKKDKEADPDAAKKPDEAKANPVAAEPVAAGATEGKGDGADPFEFMDGVEKKD